MVESWLVVEPQVNKTYVSAKEVFTVLRLLWSNWRDRVCIATNFKNSLEFGIKSSRPIKFEELFD